MIAAAATTVPAHVHDALGACFRNDGGIYARSSQEGYWSNIDADAQRELLDALQQQDFEQVVREKLPDLQGFVLGERRAAGLDLLGIAEEHVGIDLGCMWGNLLVAAARRCRAMVGVDKTREHLLFLQHRLAAERLDNVALLNADLREDLGLPGVFDFAIVNGVMEWLPTEDDVALNSRGEQRRARFVRPSRNPRSVQLSFLRNVQSTLKPGGSLYLAIENRYDYQHFLWKPDPHVQLWFTAQAPRRVANLIANVVQGRPYVNYLYSARQLETLMQEAGFSRVERYVAFPNYRHPLLILPLQREAAKQFRDVYPEKAAGNVLKKTFRQARSAMDTFVYRHLGRLDLAPALIFIGRK